MSYCDSILTSTSANPSRLIQSCDETLQSVEKHLSTFQVDLGTVSAEIETLQARSAALSEKLDVRKEVEKLLGPVIERISIPPAVVKKISEGPIDDAWVDCLEDLQSYAKSFATEQESQDIKAVEDVKPLIEDLSTKVCTWRSGELLELPTDSALSGGRADTRSFRHSNQSTSCGWHQCSSQPTKPIPTL